MAKGISTRLKDQNRWQLWSVIAFNAAIFFLATQWAAIELSGYKAALEEAAKFLPAGLAVIIATAANGLLSSAVKEKLVFLRLKHVLPGHRAFSVHAPADPRIDPARLKKACGNKLPADPEAENRQWYRFHLEMQGLPAVVQVHRDYLLLRDYTGLAALFLVGLGIADPFVVASPKALGLHLAFLVLQFLVVRHAAMTYGVRFVCTVLAQKAGKAGRQPATSGASATSRG